MRKGCLFSVTSTLFIIALLLLATRSQKIERGLRLPPYESGGFTYRAWSYGHWIESKQSGVHVSTYASPYTLVISIQPHDSGVETIELLSATIISKNGIAYSVFDQAPKKIDEVKARPSSGIDSPYAVFILESALESIEDISLELKFRIGSGVNATPFTQTLEISGFEKEEQSFIFLDAISGV